MFGSQLRSVIEWNNPAPDAVFEKWSSDYNEIKDASKLIVGPGQGCIFVYEGKQQGTYLQPGIVDLAHATRLQFQMLGRKNRLNQCDALLRMEFIKDFMRNFKMMDILEQTNIIENPRVESVEVMQCYDEGIYDVIDLKIVAYA